MPKLSVIVPVYNTAEYLRQCVESVLSQSFEDMEVICVDNHSTDSSADILREYAGENSRVKFLTTEKHGKPPQTRQCGLDAAKGEFITFVDSDDSIRQGMYEHMFLEQEKHGADIVACNYDMVYPDKITPSYSDMRDEVIDVAKLGYKHYFTKYFCMPKPNNYLWSRIIRRSIATQNNIDFQAVDISEDTIFTMLCTAFANKVVHISDSYYNYFQREDSTTRETIRSRNIADSYVFAFDCVEQYANAHGLRETFADIMPIYAATRVRSILFYTKLAGIDNHTAHSSLASALKGSSMPQYLNRAVAEDLIDDVELQNIVYKALEILEKAV